MRGHFRFLVVLVLAATPGCRIFGNGIPCEASSDCPARYPICTELDGARTCVGPGGGDPVDGDGGTGKDAGPVPHDDGGASEDGGVDGGPGDAGAEDAGSDGGLVDDPCDVLGITAVSPICLDDEGEPTSLSVVVEGSGFAVAPNGGKPSVTVADVGTPSDVELDGCEALAGGGQVCTTLTFTFPGVVEGEDYALEVENPPPWDCEIESALLVRSRPRLTSYPPEVCAGSPVVVTGDDLTSVTSVRLDGVEGEFSLFGATKLRAHFPEVPDTSATLTVDSGGCSTEVSISTAEAPVAIGAFPTVLFSPDGGEIQLYAGAEGMSTAPAALLHDGATETPVELVQALPGQGLAVFLVDGGAASLVPGDYTLELEPAPGLGRCPVEVPGALRVPSPQTSVVVANAAQASAAEVATNEIWVEWGFDDVTNPDLGGPHVPTLFLAGPTDVIPTYAPYEEDGRFVATVYGQELLPGTYDLWVSDTWGEVRAAAQSLTVFEGPPLQVDNVQPMTLSLAQDTSVSVAGRGFSTAESMTVTLACMNVDGSVTYPLAGEPASVHPLGASFTVRMNPFLPSDSCAFTLVRDDGMQVSVDGLSRPGQSGPLSFSTGPSLSTPRAGAAAVAVPLGVGRGAVYVLGGSDGGPLDAVERIDVTGSRVGRWRSLRPLPFPLAGATAVALDRSVFLIGGADEEGPTGGVWVSRVLPSSELALSASIVRAEEGEGLPPGIYHYAIAIERPAGAPLPGEGAATTTTVSVPPGGPPKGVLLTWNDDPSASGYFVYRAGPGEAPWAVTRLASTSAGVFLDTGALAPDGVTAPRRPDDLGDFVSIGTITPRAGHAAVPIVGPTGDKSIVLAGGAGSTGPLALVERLRIDDTPAGASFTLETLPSLLTARANVAALAVPDPATGSWHLFVGPGLVADSTIASAFETLAVDDATAGWASPNVQVDAAGYRLLHRGDRAVLIGGIGGAPSTGMKVAPLCNGGCPTLTSFSDGVASLSTPRIDPAVVEVAGRALVIGGFDGNGALGAVELTGPLEPVP